ncbi:MAG TPA: hypothetical protein VET24_02200 [Actinomycetota bacterium]|nr:hypothetical protein [Actinomycetota bacterium]
MASASTKRILVRLLRVSALAALGVVAARLLRPRQVPPEGHWHEGISGNGLVSGDRR